MARKYRKLATAKDLTRLMTRYYATRKIVGWSLDTHMRDDLVMEAFTMAAHTRDIPDSAVIHSDRGVQYRSNRYQEMLQDYGFRCSMSRQGNCWDNAVMESFFSRLKVELIYAENYTAVDQARAGIFEYIELFYNPIRRHSANGYISPNQYERKYSQLDVSTFRG